MGLFEPARAVEAKSEQQEDLVDALLKLAGYTTDWAFNPAEHEAEVACPLDGHELDIHFHGGASCPQCGSEFEVGRDGVVLPSDNTVGEMAAQWPDTLPWGQKEQDYYRTSMAERTAAARVLIDTESSFKDGPVILDDKGTVWFGMGYHSHEQLQEEMLRQGGGNEVARAEVQQGNGYANLVFGHGYYSGLKTPEDQRIFNELKDAGVDVEPYVRPEDRPDSYYEQPNWHAKTAMAERSGDPALDKLIEEFGPFYEQIAPRIQAEPGAEPLPTLDHYRDPNASAGMCGSLAMLFEHYAQSKGFDAQFSQAPYDTPEGLGYTDRTNQGHDDHASVIVTVSSGKYSIDFSASQYGYKEFPMVQRLDDNGGWQRQWTSAVPPPTLGQDPDPYRVEWERQNRSTAAAPQVTMYHISDRRNRDSISQQGLLPMHGMEDFVPEGERLLWLFTDPQTAEQHATKSWGGSQGNNDVWEVNTTGIPTEPDRDGMHPHAVMARQPIEPSRLRLVGGPASSQEAPGADDADSWSPSASPSA